VCVGSRSDNGKEFHGFGAQAAKLRGPKVEVRQASTCKSPRAAERKWRRLVLSILNVLKDLSQWRAYYIQIKSNQIYFSVAGKTTHNMTFRY